MVFSYRFIILAGLGFIPVVLWPTVLTIFTCLVVLGAIALVDLLAAASPRQILIQRRIDPMVRLDETTDTELILRSTGKRKLRGSVRDHWQPTAGDKNPEQKIMLSPESKLRVRSQLRPTRRGTLRTENVTIRSWGPIGAVGRQVTHPAPGSITVLPPFHSRRHLPSRLAQLREMDGRSAVQIRGAGQEFDSLRDYVAGDDVRSIDWRATARKQDLVVRTWRPERDRRVVIVLDSSRNTATRVGDETRFDSSVEAALLLAALANSGGDRVEMITMDQQVRARASSAQKGRLLHRMVSALADIQPRLLAADWTQLPIEVSQVAKQRALVVVLTTLDSAAIEEGLLPVLPVLAKRHQVLIASVDDPELLELAKNREDASSTYQASAAERQQLRVEELIRLIRRFGAEVVQASPEELPPAVADTYLRLKAAGRL